VATPHRTRRAEKEFGITVSVCEAAALIAAGAEKLVLEKFKTSKATIAVAEMACRDRVDGRR
jgi:cobalamin biosynthesis protein CbiG